jgi:predicted DNA-binding protein (MmcQ/YjbR family)
MNHKDLENIFLSKAGASVDFPFGDDVFVFKVMNKMFGLFSLKDAIYNINLKCDPQDAIAYRDIYECVIPGYHMNKKHWNTIVVDGSMPADILEDMIEESYSLVVSKLTKKQRAELQLK